MKVEMNDSRRYINEISMPTNRKVEQKEVKFDQETQKSKEPAKKVANDENEQVNEKIREVVEEMNKELEKSDTSIRFKIHESSGIGLNEVSIAVVEKESEKVIAEIPSEESIEFAEKMKTITGLLFDHSR